MEEILKEVRKERERQNDLWGQQNHFPTAWVAILAEELGEVSREAVDLEFNNPVKEADGRRRPVKALERAQRGRDYRKELIELAAVAIQAAEAYDREEFPIAL